MVKIRLARNGRKELPSYRIVVSDSRRRPTSACIADLGYFDPIHNQLKIDEKEALKWLNNGAIPSDTVKSLFKKKKINEKFAKMKQEYYASKPKKEKKEKPAKKVASKPANKTTKPASKPAAKKEETKTTAKKTTTKAKGE